ncbi:Uroporphyrinogen-III synthase [Cladobotryum mycophilum]|uniref:Uroporphyrinogen-III synthase n=1 Tax=Cladobotryum mycophilum TaxID=491253 RepID=A0ABR0SUH8_9HYPO
MPSAADLPAQPIPVLLLKTKSTPGDSYEELLSTSHNGFQFAPRFVPVLLHRFEDEGINRLRSLLRGRRIGANQDCEFGGLIFTSQRAVEVFAHIVQEGPENDDPEWPHLQHVPIYSVGPATTRAIGAVPQQPPIQIFGGHTGNGDALARFILPHYAEWYGKDGRSTLPPLLFPVGEQRRDIIPKTLMDPALAKNQRIEVAEEVVYGTGVMESFPADLENVLQETQSISSRWVVVFSPTGCDGLLRGLGLLDDVTGKFVSSGRDGKTFVATIGPTTRNHLVNNFNFEPDVCAEAPTPAGVMQGIIAFESKRTKGET